jgi:hypothetical protein
MKEEKKKRYSGLNEWVEPNSKMSPQSNKEVEPVTYTPERNCVIIFAPFALAEGENMYSSRKFSGPRASISPLKKLSNEA